MKRRIKITINSPVILLFILVCFIATLLGYVGNGYFMSYIFVLYHSHLSDPMTYIRLITHVFGHAGWNHFLGNASYILLLGPMLEEKYGPKNISIVIVVTAITTGLIHYFLFPLQALCGASGVVFALIILNSFAGYKKGEIPITFILISVLFIGQQVYEGIAVMDNVSQLTHIIGGIIGGVAGCVLNNRKS